MKYLWHHKVGPHVLYPHIYLKDTVSAIFSKIAYFNGAHILIGLHSKGEQAGILVFLNSFVR